VNLHRLDPSVKCRHCGKGDLVVLAETSVRASNRRSGLFRPPRVAREDCCNASVPQHASQLLGSFLSRGSERRVGTGGLALGVTQQDYSGRSRHQFFPREARRPALTTIPPSRAITFSCGRLVFCHTTVWVCQLFGCVKAK
jgi:hypothetical protein